MYRPSYWPRLVLAAALFAALAAPAFAQQPEIDKAAADLANSLRIKYGNELGKERVAVIPFARFRGLVNEFGMLMAEKLSQSLSNQNANLDIVPQKQLRDFIEQERLPLEWWSDTKAARWIADRQGATLAVVGLNDSSKEFIKLRLLVVQVSEWQQIAAINIQIPKVPELERLFETAPKAFTPGYKTYTPHALSFPDGVERPGRNGVGFPECAACPPPGYTQAARDAKCEGTVLLQVIIDSHGRANPISIIRGLPFGLNQQAIKAVTHWSFWPARDAKGKAVPTHVMTEVTFRLF